MTLHNVSYKINEPQKARERQQIGSSFFFSLFFSFCFFRWRLRETFEYTCKVGVRDTEKDGVKQQGWTERIQGTDREKPREGGGGREEEKDRAWWWVVDKGVSRPEFQRVTPGSMTSRDCISLALLRVLKYSGPQRSAVDEVSRRKRKLRG